MKYLLLLLLICASPEFVPVNAQTAIASSGGEANGTGGTVSFTTGQVAYTVHESSTGMVIQGCQQPYEVFVITGTKEETGKDETFTVFPNPSSDYVILRIDGIDHGSLSLQLFNNSGNLILKKKISGRDTVLDMQDLPPSAYILNILDRQIVIEKFVILKN